jgi:hypothetical protein
MSTTNTPTAISVEELRAIVAKMVEDPDNGNRLVIEGPMKSLLW